METIRVNMTPCEDVQTIHASQNDGEGREWEFALHNNGELIDTSDVKEQMFFKAYKGGTEQLLPENTSTPTTSPFLGDIKYPQGLLTNQEFTYRQSPTQSDGNAKIQAIYGNTLKWNQLINQSTYDNTETVNGITFTKNADGSVTANGTATANAVFELGSVSMVDRHKYLIKSGFTSNGSATTYEMMILHGLGRGVNINLYTSSTIITHIASDALPYARFVVRGGATVSNLKCIPQMFDLTAMGLDSLTNAEILQWFADYYPLPYYQYDSGSLLSFRGEGLKTVGRNLFGGLDLANALNSASATSTIDYNNKTVTFTHGNNNPNIFTMPFKANTVYTFICSVANLTNRNASIRFLYTDGTNTVALFAQQSNTVYVTRSTQGKTLKGIRLDYYADGLCELKYEECGLFEGIKNADDFEPYTSSTLSLPISTYFPTGMKSAGTVYDELTETKATTRIGEVDLGSRNWNYFAQTPSFFYVTIADAVSSGSADRGICSKYDGASSVSAGDKIFTWNGTQLRIRDDSFTSATAFKQAMADQNVKLYYELATPIETSFTTASLVTENAEIPLSNEDGTLIGKCTEQLSENPGFFDAKIKLTDSDGECYSNKIQLHVERSPK